MRGGEAGGGEEFRGWDGERVGGRRAGFSEVQFSSSSLLHFEQVVVVVDLVAVLSILVSIQEFPFYSHAVLIIALGLVDFRFSYIT